MWRTALQKNILRGPSNDSAMFNLFYNDMRNRIALIYIGYLKTHLGQINLMNYDSKS